MLNKLAQLLSRALFLAYDELHGRTGSAHLRSEMHRQALLMLAIWAAYLCGAVIAAWTERGWGVRALLLPAMIVFGVVAFDWRYPFVIQEEALE